MAQPTKAVVEILQQTTQLQDQILRESEELGRAYKKLGNGHAKKHPSDSILNRIGKQEQARKRDESSD